MVPFIEVLDRAHTGPICEPKDWDVKLIPSKVGEKLKEHGLQNTCDKENPINTDDGLADEFWRAGFEFAVELGMICLDTKRIIKFTEAEVKEAIKNATSEITLGSGGDKVTIKSRRPEDKQLPRFRSGVGPTSEDSITPLVQGIAQYKIIDVLSPPSLTTVQGRPLKSGTPYETLAGVHEAALVREGVRRAGRPGMPLTGVASSPTEYGLLGGYGIPYGYNPSTDMAIILPPSELKTSYGLLHKVAHVLSHGGLKSTYGSHWSMIGGYVGPTEGATVTAVAAIILQVLVHRLTISCGIIFDVRYAGNVGCEALWANSVAAQAGSRNTDILVGGFESQVSGPCMYEILYEMAAGAVEQSVSGCCADWGNRSAGGKYVDHKSPLEQKFSAEVVKSAAGLSRDDANEIVKVLLPKYEDKLPRADKGKSFTECFDLKTLKPTKEWQDIYDSVWKELEDLGLQRLY